MNVSRRGLLTSGVAAGSLVSFVSFGFGKDPVFRRGGVFRTQKKLLTGRTDRERPTHTQYCGIIQNEAEANQINWEHFETERPVYAKKFSDADLSDGFLLFAGLRLPDTQQLESVATTFDGGEMRATYEVIDATSASDRVQFHTAVEYWVTESEPPEELTVSYNFSDESI